MSQLQEKHQLILCVGVEIEFYLSQNIDINLFESILGYKLQKEDGLNQYEVQLDPTIDLAYYCDNIINIINDIKNCAKQLSGVANLESKPYFNDYGNSMHFHINFISISNRTIKENLYEFSARSICHFMEETFLAINSRKNDYLRLDHKYMAPTHISYGNNNRSVAIRIPASYPKRLEYRLPNPNSDPYLTILILLKSIIFGLDFPDKITNLDKIYGNAWDRQYNLVSLPQNIIQSFQLFNKSFFTFLT